MKINCKIEIRQNGLPERIQAAIAESGQTLSQVARAIGLTPSGLTNYALGYSRSIPLSLLLALEQYLGVDLIEDRSAAAEPLRALIRSVKRSPKAASTQRQTPQ